MASYHECTLMFLTFMGRRSSENAERKSGTERERERERGKCAYTRVSPWIKEVTNQLSKGYPLFALEQCKHRLKQ